MATVEMVRSWVEKTIAEFLGIDSVVVDQDGDVPIRTGSAMIYARLFEGASGPIFRVFSPVLRGVEKPEALLERLNEMNAAAIYVRYAWSDGHVVCSMELPADTLQVADVATALNSLSWSADHFDDLLKTDFGGTG